MILNVCESVYPHVNVSETSEASEHNSHKDAHECTHLNKCKKTHSLWKIWIFLSFKWEQAREPNEKCRRWLNDYLRWPKRAAGKNSFWKLWICSKVSSRRSTSLSAGTNCVFGCLNSWSVNQFFGSFWLIYGTIFGSWKFR